MNTELNNITPISLDGSMGKGGHKPIEFFDTAGSTQTVKLLLALGEGEIEQLDDSDVLLNNTPLPNFAAYGTTLETRMGTAGQTVIGDFVDTESPLQDFAATELKYNEYVYFSIPPTANAVRVTLTVGALSQVWPNNDLVYYWTIVNIATIPYEGALEYEQFSTQEVGKHSSPYSWDVVINRPTNYSPNLHWKIKLSRATFNDSSMGVKYRSQTSVTSIVQLLYTSYTYPNTALAYLKFTNASVFGNRVPSVKFRPKGEKIYVPSNYTFVEPENYTETTSLYSGEWDGTFKPYTVYTDSIIWHFYNVITKHIKPPLSEEDIDVGQLYLIDKYLSSPVLNGKGGWEPRATVNKCFSTRLSVPEFLTQLLSLGNCNLTINQFGQVSLFCDMPGQQVEDIITNSDVIDGLFIYSSNDLESRHTVANVTFEDPFKHGNTNTVSWPVSGDFIVGDTNYTTRYGVNYIDILQTGCTSIGQAYRKARWALATNTVYTRLVSFKRFIQGMSNFPGQVVKIMDCDNNGMVQQGRILEVTEIATGQYSLILDREITIYASPKINKLNFWNTLGELQTDKTLLDSNGENLITSSTNSVVVLSDTEPFVSSVFQQEVYDGTDNYKVSELFKILSVKKEENYYNITAVIHSEDKYAWIDDIAAIPDGGWTNTDAFHLVPPAVTGVTAIEYTSPFKLTVAWSWSPPIGVSETVTYDVRYQRDKDPVITLSGLTNQYIDILNPKPGNYIFAIIAVDTVSKKPSPATTLTVPYRVSANTSPFYPPINVSYSGI